MTSPMHSEIGQCSESIPEWLWLAHSGAHSHGASCRLGAGPEASGCGSPPLCHGSGGPEQSGEDREVHGLEPLDSCAQWQAWATRGGALPHGGDLAGALGISGLARAKAEIPPAALALKLLHTRPIGLRSYAPVRVLADAAFGTIEFLEGVRRLRFEAVGGCGSRPLP